MTQSTPASGLNAISIKSTLINWSHKAQEAGIKVFWRTLTSDVCKHYVGHLTESHSQGD